MASYSVALQPSAEKDLRRIPAKSLTRIFSKIEELAIEPLPHGVVKLATAERLYRLRVGEYRIVYELRRDEREILIYYVRHRSEVYRQL